MAIVAAGITKTFGDFVALDDVSVDVPSGRLTALLGPSGGGKSTLLRVIAGLEFADRGRIDIEGVDATWLPPQRRSVGFVFQHYAAFKHLSVYRNVAFGLEIRKRPKAEIATKVTELLELVHLEKFADRLPGQLSGGQRQRMALARALAIEPKVLLLDEPFGALDAKVRKELRDWLRRLHDEVHVTTIFVTHDQEEALEVADEIVVINDGRIEQVGTPDDLYDKPANEFVMSFLGPVTQLNGRLVRPHDIEVLTAPQPGATRAEISRVQRVGFEIRAEMSTAPGQPDTWVQLNRGQSEALRICEGATVWLLPAPNATSVRARQTPADAGAALEARDAAEGEAAAREAATA
ncbi:sulfate/molybdate ABC transporter ATP-binding protein [Jatrophihabitans fulvus]